MSSLPQSEILENFQPQSLAELLPAAMLRQDRGPLAMADQQMAASSLFKGAALAGQEAFRLVAVHGWSLQHLCCAALNANRNVVIEKECGRLRGESRPRANPVGDGEG